ncbi:hypothetical protein AB0K89_05400 [Streptomyces cinnamoneus]|uniref:hypothetical protein n=1 Tax=Streptomyces cinnamoneus TaxID=53446 RepID=UPI00341A3C81
MSHRWKITVIVVAVAAIVSTPLVWLLGSPNAGQLAGASIQAATGIAALLWAVLASPPAPAPARDVVRRTGAAEAKDGGLAVAGIKHPEGSGGTSALVEDMGPSTAHGQGSSAVSGVEIAADRPGQSAEGAGTVA